MQVPVAGVSFFFFLPREFEGNLTLDLSSHLAQTFLATGELGPPRGFPY